MLSAYFHLQRLQFENDAGAGHDLFPAQSAWLAAMQHQPVRNGLMRQWIDCQPDVAPLRNRIDAWLTPPTPQDVLELMDLRSRASQTLGYNDYPDAILTADGLTLSDIRARLSGILSAHLEEASGHARTLGIDTIAQWYPVLLASGRLSLALDPLPLLQLFAASSGFASLLPQISMSIAPGTNCFAACTGVGQYQMQLSPVDTLYGWRTLFHEFGHLCTYMLTPPEQLPRLNRTVDECIAVLFEYTAVQLFAPDEFRRALLQEWIADYTRMAVSAMFELDLWASPGRAEILYHAWYSRLIPSPDPAAWARDSFRSIDCMTAHAYALGLSEASAASPEYLLSALRSLCTQAASLTLPQLHGFLQT